MENFRIVRFNTVSSLLGVILFTPLFSLAYDQHSTHPALTQDIVSFYNYHFHDRPISDQEKELIIRGSIDEDDGVRFMRHFYDPVFNRGLTLGNSPTNPQLAFIGSAARLQWSSSKQWAENSSSQSGNSGLAGIFGSYFSDPNDYSWERSIYEYVWGDKNRALKGLGHVLHLLEDATVPDHTRNDPHPPFHEYIPSNVSDELKILLSFQASPYEIYGERYRRDNITIADSLRAKRDTPIFKSNITEYFDALALYSSNNFFSKDTIFSTYELPKIEFSNTKVEILSDGEPYEFAYANNQASSYKLLLLGLRKFGSKQNVYSIKDRDDLILQDYWSLLSKQAVLHGAGVIKLFFDEVEKEKQIKILYNKNRSWWQRSMDKFKRGVFNTASVLYGSSVKLSDLENKEDQEDKKVIVTPPPAEIETPKIEAPQVVSQDNAGNEQANAVAENLPKDSAAGTSAADGAPDAVVENSPPKLTPDPAITNGNSSGRGGVFVVSGNLPPGAGAAPPPAPPPSTPEPQSESPAPPPPPPPDTTPPDITFVIQECESDSLSSEICLLSNSAIQLSWSSAASDADHYEITCEVSGSSCAGFSFSPTTATSTGYTLTTEKTLYTFKAKAIDTAGNISTEVMRTLMVDSRPVVINEVAWMGTGSSAITNKDEWIELYNPTNYSVNLSGWTISFFEPATTSPSHTISFSGSIGSKSFYLVERTDDNTVADVTADLTSSFGSSGLLNSGMMVKLERGGAAIDRTPDLCGGAWCAGSNVTYDTMERVDLATQGELVANWATHSDFSANIRNGTGAESNQINGTPKKRNSQNYLITPQGVSLSQHKTLTKDNSPYIVPGALTIANGATLTVNPGVVIKMTSSGEWDAQGKIAASGISAEKIVFTSIHDDSHAGDTNNNGAATIPQAADWKRIKLSNPTDTSTFDYVIIRYGGPGCGWACPGPEDISMLNIAASPVDIKNSTIEYSFSNGVYTINSSGAISNTTFRNNNAPTMSGSCFCGLGVNGGSITIQGNTFDGNRNGLYIASGTHPVASNSFSNNSGVAIEFAGGMPTFSGNSASGNGKNGIVLSSPVAADYTFEKDLAYIGGPSVASGKTVIVKPGVVFKNNDTVSVNGTLKAEGTASLPVVFTSLQDDTYGGDTNNDGICDPGNASSTAACPSPGGWVSLNFAASSVSSTLKHVLIRYGSNCALCGGFPNGAVKVNSTSVEIANATFEKNRSIGLWLSNSASTTVASSVFREHTGTVSSLGMQLDVSSVTLDGVTFSNNDTGIAGDGASSVSVGPAGVTFTGNTTDDSPSTLIP